MADHPRSRGEYDFVLSFLMHRGGSSPLSRGIRKGHHVAHCFPRIIPALAGNTQKPSRSDEGARDHPRSRGEYVDMSTSRQTAKGSSPLSRGIRESVDPNGAKQRIIPALAGNTALTRRATARSWDHPRSRGEYPHHCVEDTFLPGSSPLSRGIHRGRRRGRVLRRIIPALAGNTACRPGRVPRERDHPRSRGEYRGMRPSASRTAGSSPLSRGIRTGRGPGRVGGRIIPALAGNTRLWLLSLGQGRDHPRSRGEYHVSSGRGCPRKGSSPLSRGIRFPVTDSNSLKGIIPALAGNTSLSSTKDRLRPDHPRSRGEYSPPPSSATVDIGSSPLSRGILNSAHTCGL